MQVTGRKSLRKPAFQRKRPRRDASALVINPRVARFRYRGFKLRG